MTPTMTDSVPVPAPPPTDEPTFEECHAEWLRYYEARNAGGLIDPRNEHPNEFVAFYDGRVIGYSTDATALQNRAAEALGVHPARVVIAYLLAWEA